MGKIYFRILLLIFVLTPYSVVQGATLEENDRKGGRCEYAKYKGYANITFVKKDFPYKVTFTFSPLETINEPLVRTKEYSFPLDSISCLPQEFIEMYHVQPGQVFDCYMKVITKGSCTPVLFEFPTIKVFRSK